MKTNTNKNGVNQKITDLNNSINRMIVCAKHLEKMRAFHLPTAISEEELQTVLSQLKYVEKSIEKLSHKESKNDKIFKAIGQNRKIWVTKP